MARSENLEELREIIQKILVHRRNIDSSTYIRGYDIVFTECTKQTGSYEILGRHIYDLLSDEMATHLVTHYQNIPVSGDILVFTSTYRTFSEGLSVIRNVFSYLSRYFIKTNREACDPSVMEIKSLGLSVFYTTFVTRHINLFITAVADELRNPRKSRIAALKRAVGCFKQAAIHSGNHGHFTRLLREYVELGKTELLNSHKDVSKFCRMLKKRLYITQKVFDTVYVDKLTQTLVKAISHRSGELIDFFMIQIRNKKDNALVFEILEILGAQQIFEEKLFCFLKGEVHARYFLDPPPEALEKSFRFLFDFHNSMCYKLQKEPRYARAFADALEKFTQEECEDFFLQKIHVAMCTKDIEGCEFVERLIGKRKPSAGFLDRLIQGIKGRLLLGVTQVEAEKQLITAFKGQDYQIFVNRATRCVQDIECVIAVYQRGQKTVLAPVPYDSLFENADGGIDIRPFSAGECQQATLDLHSKIVKTETFNFQESPNLIATVFLLTKTFWGFKEVSQLSPNVFENDPSNLPKATEINTGLYNPNNLVKLTCSAIKKDSDEQEIPFTDAMSSESQSDVLFERNEMSNTPLPEQWNGPSIISIEDNSTMCNIKQENVSLSDSLVDSDHQNEDYQIDEDFDTCSSDKSPLLHNYQLFESHKGPLVSESLERIHACFKGKIIESHISNTVEFSPSLSVVIFRLDGVKIRASALIYTILCLLDASPGLSLQAISREVRCCVQAEIKILMNAKIITLIDDKYFISESIADLKQLSSAEQIKVCKNAESTEIVNNKKTDCHTSSKEGSLIELSVSHASPKHEYSNYYLQNKFQLANSSENNVISCSNTIDLVNFENCFMIKVQLQNNTENDPIHEIKCRLTRIFKRNKKLEIRELIKITKLSESKLISVLNDFERDEIIERIGKNTFKYIP